MPPQPRLHPFVMVLLLAVLVFSAGSVWAAPTPGFVEDWPGTSTQNWAGAVDLSNPGTGGLGGVGDGYLQIALDADGSFGARSTGPEYVGDWIVSGVQRVMVSLKDVGAPDAFQIHFAIGNASNFWQYDAAFVPVTGVWQTYMVNVSSSVGFTQIIGTGTFEDALRHVDRVLLRNDQPPFVQTPNPTHGDLGVDRLTLFDTPTNLTAPSWGRIKRLYRSGR